MNRLIAITTALTYIEAESICKFVSINQNGEIIRFTLGLSISNDSEKMEGVELHEAIFSPNVYISGTKLYLGKFLDTNVEIYANLSTYSKLNNVNNEFEEDFDLDSVVESLIDYFA